MATHMCAIIHVGANSATEKHAHLTDAVNPSEIALCSTGVLLFAGIMFTADIRQPLWEIYQKLPR